MVPENCRDHCQHLANNPRREGLPKTVTEWRLQREERRRIRREERRRTKDVDLRSESEGEDISAFDIIIDECNTYLREVEGQVYNVLS